MGSGARDVPTGVASAAADLPSVVPCLVRMSHLSVPQADIVIAALRTIIGVTMLLHPIEVLAAYLTSYWLAFA